jgi:glutamyl-tRNA reductase
LSEHDRRAVESLTAQIVSKLLHLPTVRMKEAAAGAEGGVYADVVRDLFGLEDDAGSNRLPRE